MSGIPFGRKQRLAQLRAQGFTSNSRFYGRVLLPRELQESEDLRKSVGCPFKTVDYFGDVSGDRLIITRLKWVPATDGNGNPELKLDGTPKFTLVPGLVYQDGFAILHYWNQWGRIYFYPCHGGRFNSDIAACPSGYFESDDGTFEKQ